MPRQFFNCFQPVLVREVVDSLFSQELLFVDLTEGFRASEYFLHHLSCFLASFIMRVIKKRAVDIFFVGVLVPYKLCKSRRFE
jgi:hypothetical protein